MNNQSNLIDAEKVFRWAELCVIPVRAEDIRRAHALGLFAPDPEPTIKTGDEGLYNKYTVINNETGKQVEGACFVLRPDRDNAAYGALLLYAELTTNTDLAVDLTGWLSSLEVPHG